MLPNFIAGLAPNSAAVESGLGPVTPPPVSAPPPAPMAPAPASHPSGLDRTAAVLKQLLPALLSAIAAKKGGALAGNAVLQGFAQDAEAKRKDEAEQAKFAADVFGKQQDALYKQGQQRLAQGQQELQRTNAVEAFVSHLQNELSTNTDPVTFASAVKQGADYASRIFGVDPKIIESRFTFDNTKKLKADQKAAADLIGSLQKVHGENFGPLMEQGATIEFQGQRRPIKDIFALAGYDAQLPSGKTLTVDEPIVVPTTEAQSRAAFVADARKKAKLAGKPFTQSDAIAAANDGSKQWVQTHHVPSAATSASGGGDDVVSEIVDGITSGKQPPTLTGLYRLSGPVRAGLQRAGYDLTRATQDWKATERFLATVNGAQQTRLRQAAQTAFDSLQVIEDLSTQLSKVMPRSRFPMLNKAALSAAVGGALGPQAQTIATQLRAQISDLTSELGNVYMGGNSPTDHALSLAAKNLAAEWTEKQLKDAIALARQNLQIRLNSISLAAPIGGSAENVYAPRGTGAGPAGTPVAAGTIRVKLADGRTGTMSASESLPPGAVIIK